MGDFGAVRDKWVCPNDRELSLRAKLRTGWSVKTNSINTFSKPTQINDAEQEVIMSVIRRAENLDKVEQERVGRLVERLENMKKNAMGNGATQCVLCADEFGILGASPLLCNDCKKAVCTKCGVDTFSANKEPLWLCKICAETRETWKKSGAWFYKGLPKYILPGKKSEPSKYSTTASPSKPPEQTQSPQRTYNSWLNNKGKNTSEKENTDSSDDEFKSSRLAKRATVRKPYAEPAEPAESPVTTLQPDTAAQGPSPTHLLYSPAIPDSPRSPQHHAPPDFNRPPPGHEGFSPHSKERRVAEADRNQTATASHWYKPGTRREAAPEQEEYSERTIRGHNRKESQHSPVARYRPPSSTHRSEGGFEEKTTSPEESSKKSKRFYHKKKRRK